MLQYSNYDKNENKYKNNKESIGKRRRRKYVYQIVISLIVAGLIILGCIRQNRGIMNLYFNNVPIIVDNTNDASFKLVQILRHGTGKHYQMCQKLDITPEIVSDAGDLFQTYRQEQLLLLEEGKEDEFDIDWPQDEKYETDNPFDFELKMKSTHIPMKKLDTNFVFSQLAMGEEYTKAVPESLLQWIDDDEALAPNVTDKDTVISLALMSSNAYVRTPHTGDWRNVSMPWNHSVSPGIGWEGDGIRGHVFYDNVNNIVVLSLKGTSAQGLPGSGIDETTVNDKLNDNILFSCCCARVSYLWTTACGCYVKSNTCDEICLESELRRKDRYYKAALDIFQQVELEYSNATMWLTGHSLGGALASLVGRTFGIPAVTFEAPGEELASERLHLPKPPGLPEYQEGIWHFGHTADPIFMGTCNGASSTCSMAGYAMETACHTGRVCVYDVVKDKGWYVNMLHHRIHTVIDDVLTQYDSLAKCVEPEPCVDCYSWRFVKGLNDPDLDNGKKKKIESSTSISSIEPSISSTTVASTIISGTSKPKPTCFGRNWLGICTKYGQT